MLSSHNKTSQSHLKITTARHSLALYIGSMNSLKWLFVVGLALLSACAPTTATVHDDLSTPILAPVQVWTLIINPVPGQKSIEPTSAFDMVVGSPSRYGTVDVGFRFDRLDAAEVIDGFYYHPKDGNADYIAATRVQRIAGIRVIRQCTVRNPVNQLNVPQIGMFQSGTNSFASDLAFKEYLDNGTLTGQTTCTLLRIV